MGSYLVFCDVGWSLARDRNIGADILLRYSQTQFKEMACMCCLLDDCNDVNFHFRGDVLAFAGFPPPQAVLKKS